MAPAQPNYRLQPQTLQEALTRYCTDDGAVPIDNNWVKARSDPWALGRSNWLLRVHCAVGQRAAAVTDPNTVSEAGSA